MEPFIGQVLLFAGNFAPRGWAFCDGQLLSISQHQALFSILGTTYGGDGRTTFGLPDLRGRVPVHPGNGPGLSHRKLGEKGGTESETLNLNQVPSHSHPYSDKTSIGGATTSGKDYYFSVPASWGKPLPTSAASSTETSDQSTGATGGGSAHNNLPPYQCVNYIIALVGVYPSRS